MTKLPPSAICAMSEGLPQDRKTQLAFAVAQGSSLKKWAEANNVSRATAYRWADEPEVKACGPPFAAAPSIGPSASCPGTSPGLLVGSSDSPTAPVPRQSSYPPCERFTPTCLPPRGSGHWRTAWPSSRGSGPVNTLETRVERLTQGGRRQVAAREGGASADGERPFESHPERYHDLLPFQRATRGPADCYPGKQHNANFSSSLLAVCPGPRGDCRHGRRSRRRRGRDSRPFRRAGSVITKKSG